MEGLLHGIQQNVQRFTDNLRRAGERAADAIDAARAALPQPRAAPLLASVSSQHGGRAVQPVFEVSFNPEEIKARLNAVPVYTVVNNKNEFVLVAGDDDAKQLGLFFFTQAEAEAMLKTIKQASPSMGKTSKVLETTMDRVYDFAATPRKDTDTAGVVFRFVPDPQQVEAALQLYRHAGVAATGFHGVPLFQAEGLTIKGDTGRYTPLFFSKDDLDAALSAAFSSREDAAQADTRAKAERARGELQQAQQEVAAAASEKERKAAQRRTDQATARVQQYEQRLAEAAAKKKLPRVDVGSLEEVIVRMEDDEKGEWSDVVFVPARAVASAGAPAGGKRKK